MQTTFADMEYAERKRKTKREKFLSKMDKVIPWDSFEEIIKPYYYTNTKGRKAKGINKMLRMLFLQEWFNLSDEGVEDTIYDSYAFREFMGINFLDEQVPDATTLLKFRHLLERHEIGKKIFAEVAKLLQQNGLIVENGTVIDATIIQAPKSTKNKEKSRDPEMKSSKKGGNWYFGMKEHIGVDALNGFVHTLVATPANIHDVVIAPELLRETDDTAFGDSGYLGLEKRVDRDLKFRIAKRPSQRVEKTKNIFDKAINWEKQIEQRKSSMRCKVEYVFYVVKQIFGLKRTRYRGIAKNDNMFQMAFACANLWMLANSGRKLAIV